MNKSCKTCPNFVVDQSVVRVKLRRPVGVPICGKYGFILSEKNQSEADRENLWEAFAENCSDWGIKDTNTGSIANPLSRVADPDEWLIKQADPDVHVSSCHGCANMIRPDAVHDAFGWPLPMCRAKGTLIFNAIPEAKNCIYSKPGTPENSVQGVVLRKEFQPGFVSNPDKEFQGLVNYSSLSKEPTTYETDAEVSDEDRADGIRAWRRLIDPYGLGKEIYLPIFDSSEDGIFNEDERAEIPQTGDEDHHPELYIDYGNLVWTFAVESWTLNNTLFIQSEPGLGKTEFVYYLGWLMQLPVTRIFFTDKIEWDDIFGKLILRKGEMVFQEGTFTAPVQRPGLSCVDEPNMAPSEIVATLRTTSESARTVYLDAGIAEFDEDGVQSRKKLKIKIHNYHFVVWCGNPAWDPRNLGTKELAAADISRLSPAFLQAPPESIEKRIIRQTVQTLDGWDISDTLLNDVLKVSKDIREMSKQGEFPGTWGIRENIKVARKLPWYSFVDAYRMASLNHFEPETAEMIINASIKTIRSE